jgi:DNA repair protein RecO (recombination protein O)
MSLHKDEAFILFKRAYGESDKIIRLFTRSSGKVAVIAKGAGKSQKRFMNTLELFNHIRVEYFEKPGATMARLENADLVETNSGIEKSLKRACIAGFFTEFVDRLTKEKHPQEQLFLTLKEIIEAAKDHDFTYSDILYYQFLMLDILGYMPNLGSCVRCADAVGDGKGLHFSKEKGGVLCGNCARFVPHAACAEGLIPGLISVRDQNKPLSSTLLEGQARDIMEGFLSFHLDVEFRSYRILKRLMFS